jgi:hypothetical protein
LIDGSHTDGPLLVPEVVVTEPKMPEMKNLCAELLNSQDQDLVISYMQDGCGCCLGPGNKSCLTQFTVQDIVENRLNCTQLDYIENHENMLNTIIAAELNALLHRDEKLMCSNVSAEAQKDRQKQKMDYKFRGYNVCMKGYLFLHGIGRKRLRLLRERVSFMEYSLSNMETQVGFLLQRFSPFMMFVMLSHFCRTMLKIMH